MLDDVSGSTGATHTTTITISDFTTPLRVVTETFGDGTTAVTGYTTVFSDDCATIGEVTVNPGDIKTCTITNSKDAIIIINKITEPSVIPGQVFDFTTAGAGP